VVEKAGVNFENEEKLVLPLASQLLDAGTLDCIEAEITALDDVGSCTDDGHARDSHQACL